jgi:type IV pilus assembly protein PilW
MSLVEMMVGVAIGLVVVAGATVLAASQLTENRRLVLETQVQQDMRAASDIITRELRRAGAGSTTVPSFVWVDGDPLSGQSNTLAALHLNVGSDTVTYSYEGRASMGGPDFYGYRLSGGTIQHRIGTGAPQDLTDRNTLEVMAFDVLLADAPAMQLACTNLCSDGTQSCWPTLKVTDATITIEGRSVSDRNVRRTMVSRVRVRNDVLAFNVASSTKGCP